MVILKMVIFSELWKVDLGPFGNKLFKNSIQMQVLSESKISYFE